MPTFERTVKLMPVSTKAIQKLGTHELLRRHQLHEGLYARVAKQLGFDASYVSRIARGERDSPRILSALVEELRRIDKL
jgi:transcriptional regulator with XRE-family HTH domain